MEKLQDNLGLLGCKDFATKMPFFVRQKVQISSKKFAKYLKICQFLPL